MKIKAPRRFQDFWRLIALCTSAQPIIKGGGALVQGFLIEIVRLSFLLRIVPYVGTTVPSHSSSRFMLGENREELTTSVWHNDVKDEGFANMIDWCRRQKTPKCGPKAPRNTPSAVVEVRDLVIIGHSSPAQGKV